MQAVDIRLTAQQPIFFTDFCGFRLLRSLGNFFDKDPFALSLETSALMVKKNIFNERDKAKTDELTAFVVVCSRRRLRTFSRPLRGFAGRRWRDLTGDRCLHRGGEDTCSSPGHRGGVCPILTAASDPFTS